MKKPGILSALALILVSERAHERTLFFQQYIRVAVARQNWSPSLLQA